MVPLSPVGVKFKRNNVGKTPDRVHSQRCFESTIYASPSYGGAVLGPLPAPRGSGHRGSPAGPAVGAGRYQRRRLLPAVISPCRLGLRQTLITRLLMKPGAVCNHPGPRRAAREAAGESPAMRSAARCVCAWAGAARCSPSVTSVLF